MFEQRLKTVLFYLSIFDINVRRPPENKERRLSESSLFPKERFGFTRVDVFKHETFLVAPSNAISYINHSISQEHYTTGCLMYNGILNYINANLW